jgi:hypothetical protein
MVPDIYLVKCIGNGGTILESKFSGISYLQGILITLQKNPKMFL